MSRRTYKLTVPLTIAEQLRDRDVPCPGCGYNLRGLKNGACPECGFGFDAESLHRMIWPRPRFVVWTTDHAFAAIAVAFVVLSIASTGRAAEDGAWGLLGVLTGRWGFGLLALATIALLAAAKLSEGLSDWIWRDRFLAAAGITTAVWLAIIILG